MIGAAWKDTLDFALRGFRSAKQIVWTGQTSEDNGIDSAINSRAGIKPGLRSPHLTLPWD